MISKTRLGVQWSGEAMLGGLAWRNRSPASAAARAESGHAATPPSSVRNWRRLRSSMGSSPEPAVPAYRRLRMPRKRPQVLGADLNRSESRRRAACPSMLRKHPILRIHVGPARSVGASLSLGSIFPEPIEAVGAQLCIPHGGHRLIQDGVWRKGHWSSACAGRTSPGACPGQ